MGSGWGRRSALAAACCLGIVACGGSGGGDEAVATPTTAIAEAPIAENGSNAPSTDAPSTDAPTDDTTPPDTSSDASAPDSTEAFCPLTEGDMEGCYAFEDMQAFYDEAIFLLNGFLADTYEDPTSMQLPSGASSRKA